MENGNASSAVPFLPGRTVGVGTFRVFCFRAFFNTYLLQTPASELRPLTYRNLHSDPTVANKFRTLVNSVVGTGIKLLFYYNGFSIDSADTIQEVPSLVESRQTSITIRDMEYFS